MIVILKKQDRKLHKLKYWREVVGLKQADFAVLIGCNTPNYSMKENGNVELKRTEMILIQNALNARLKEAGKDPLTLDEIFLS